MATGAQRDQRQLHAGIARWVAAHAELLPGPVPVGRPMEVTGVHHAEGGTANETIMVGVGNGHPGVVVRPAPLEPTFPDDTLATQAVVQNAVAAGGIRLFVDDHQWIGTSFLSCLGSAVSSPARCRCSTRRLQGRRRGASGSTTTASSTCWPGSTPWTGRPPRWRWRRRSRSRETVLLWGDARLGNLIFDDDAKVRAVLEWDLATIGPPEMDLGWYFGLEFMMEQLFGQRVPGFPDRAAALVDYEERSGHTVTDLAWHEVFALVRALAINDRHQRTAEQQRLQVTGRLPSSRRVENPMIDVLAARLETAG